MYINCPLFLLLFFFSPESICFSGSKGGHKYVALSPDIVVVVCDRQQDAQEFLIYLIEGLHEDVNRVQVKKAKSMLSDEHDKLP